MFADDVCLYTIGKNVRELQMALQKCVTNADDTNIITKMCH